MKKRIMVVDDDKITLKMCKFILEKQDHEVVTAESGKRCLEFLREPSNPRIDCILLDIEMPLLNGFNTLSSIRQSEKLKDIPVMFLTASATQETVREAIRLGVTSYLRKPFLPKAFTAGNHVEEIKGVYVPFWLFDTDVNAQVRYRATSVRVWSDKDYDYTETSHFLLRRGGTIGFEHVPVDGSSKMADDLMESIEPYDFSDAVDFQTAYLAGYLADRYDVSAEQSVERANERVKKSTEDAFAATVEGYTTVTTENSHLRLRGGKAKYALYPVWLLTTSWNGDKYTFAMNGQTGKFVGDLPVDKSAARKWTLGLTAILGAVTYGAVWLLRMVGIL